MTELARGPLPPELEPLGFLLGIWIGEGTASYPTMEQDVRYGERIMIDHVGQPYLLYNQESWDAGDGSPLHLERGSVRPGPNGELELVVAHPVQGVTEIAHGRLDGTSFVFSTADGTVARTATGDPVVSVDRRYRVWGSVLTYEVELATAEVGRTLHLVGELRRSP